MRNYKIAAVNFIAMLWILTSSIVLDTIPVGAILNGFICIVYILKGGDGKEVSTTCEDAPEADRDVNHDNAS